MTSRADIPRLAGSLGVLGTVLEQHGQQAFDVMAGWTPGPTKAPAQAPDDVCKCGHSIESHIDGGGLCTYELVDEDWVCSCTVFAAAPQGSASEDRKDEAIQRSLAAKRFQQYRVRLSELDALVQGLLRDVDIACPPNPEEMKNRATGDFEPWTEAEIVLAGWCATCWNACQAWSPIPTDSKGFKRWHDRCGWCGSFRATHGIDPPKELLVKHNEGRNLSAGEVDEAVKKAKAAASPKKKGRKGKRQKAAA